MIFLFVIGICALWYIFLFFTKRPENHLLRALLIQAPAILIFLAFTISYLVSASRSKVDALIYQLDTGNFEYLAADLGCSPITAHVPSGIIYLPNIECRKAALTDKLSKSDPSQCGGPCSARVNAALCLKEMGPKAVEAVPALINVVLEKTPDYRSGEGDCLQKSAAILALAEIGDPRAVRSIQSLNCESASVARLECVFAIKALTKLSKLNPETFAGEGR